MAMSILDFTDGRAPRFERERLPDNEKEPTRTLEQTLWSLHWYCDSFADAIHLSDFCQQNLEKAKTESVDKRLLMRWRSWRRLAGRDGAMTIFHFGKSIEGAGKTLGACPTVLRGLDKSKLRSAKKMFADLFPNYEVIRHAIAHEGELWSTPTKMEKNIVNKPENMGSLSGLGIDTLIIRGSFIKDYFTSTIGGRVYSYDLSRATLANLEHVKFEFYSAFLPVPELVRWDSDATAG
jgi:hypothetical protein